MSEDSRHRNEVTLVGRLAGEIRERPMPSGAMLCSFRLVVCRDTPSPGPNIDALDCVAWLPAVRRVAQRWSAGDLVEVRGSIRRRFWRGVSGPASRCEIEVALARRLARAGGGIRPARCPVPRPATPDAVGQPSGSAAVTSGTA